MTTPAFTRALELELDLKALDLAVRLICAGPAPDPSIDLWCDVIKPLTNALVGINRGMVPHAEKVVRNSVDPETEEEAWLRSSVPWDAVTDEWVRLMDEAEVRWDRFSGIE